jgi:hypothetical protein
MRHKRDDNGRRHCCHPDLPVGAAEALSEAENKPWTR